MPITFYDCPTAPSPRRARIILAEKAIPHDVVNIDLATAQQRTPAFAAINPRLTVPALVLENGTILTDNAAIAVWAEAAFPEPPLLGTTPIEKAAVASWTTRVEFEGFMAIAEGFRNSSPAMKGRALTGPVDYDQIPELAERGKARLIAFVDTLDAQLATNRHVAGEQFSLADITAVVAVDFARILKIKPVETHANIARWRNEMAARVSMAL